MEENKEVIIDEVSVDSAKEENVSENTENTENSDNTKIIEELNAQIAELKDKYLRVAAELENTRRRAGLDIESVSRNRAMGIACKILPIMDAIEMAIKHNPEDEGLKSIFQAINNVFAQIGIVKIESVGQVLNPQFHNAIQMIDKPTPETKTNTIIEEMQSGYMFGDSVLRSAMVIVSK